MEVQELLVDDQRAAVMATFTGTDRGGFMGMPATGRRVTIPVVFLYEFRDGKIVRDRRVYDFTGMLVQVGTLKAKPA
jgi:predicted ester cyclase